MRKLVAVLLLAACGTPTPTATCKGSVDGQVKGTFSVCDDYDNLYLQNMDAFNFSADYTELPTSFTLSTDWTIPGEPKVTRYDQNTMGIDCTITVKQGELIWVSRTGGGSAAAGTCALDFTVPDGGVTSLGTMGNTEQFKLHGTLSGQLEASPGTGSSGTVNVSMDFDG